MIMEKLVHSALGSALFWATKFATSGSQSAAAVDDNDDAPTSIPSADGMLAAIDRVPACVCRV